MPQSSENARRSEGQRVGPACGASQIVGMMSFIFQRSHGLAFAVPTSELVAAFPDHMPTIAPRR